MQLQKQLPPHHVLVGISKNTGRSLKGLALNAFFLEVRGGACDGIAISGITTRVSAKNANGVFVGGASATAAGHANGIICSVGKNFVFERTRGMIVSIGQNETGGRVNGVAVSTCNDIGWNANGATFSALLTTIHGSINGIAAGPVNIAHKALNGLALGVVNWVAENANGMAVGAVNCASKAMRGVFIGLCNIADHFQGIRVGVVNISHSQSTGVEIGAINIRTGAPWYAKVIPLIAIRRQKGGSGNAPC